MKDDYIRTLWNYYRNKEFRNLVELGEKILRMGENPELRRVTAFGYDQLALHTNSKDLVRLYQKRAKELFRGILDRDKKSVQALRGLALVYLHQNQLKRSEATYKKAYSLNPKDASTILCLGNVYRAMRQYRRARYWYNRALAKKKIKPLAYINLLALEREVERKQIPKR